MPRRYLDRLSSVPSTLAYGLRTRWREGYKGADFRADLLAGLVVGVVALPLSMALGIASGVPPQHGLYTAIIAGIVCALLGGTRNQVTGPTAAFVVILVPIVQKFGLGGLLVAGFLAGVILVGMGLLGLGQLIQYIPHPVTTGFTAGIAVVIGTIQLTDVFGLKLAHRPETFIERIELMWQARATFAWPELVVAVVTLVLLLGIPKLTKRIPAPLIALTVVAALTAIVHWIWPGFTVATIGSRFHSTVNGHEVAGIPPLPPLPIWPFSLPGPDGQTFPLTWSTIHALMPSAFAIAMLGAIESLLAAVIADGMSGTKHDPNAELLALGIGNMLCPLFGGIAATGALARTATNIRAGARSPLASVIHALFILACTLLLAPLVASLPMAALAALLLLVARNMSDSEHFVHIAKVAPRSDVTVLLACFGLTVLFDMVLAVGVGVVLAALLFMRRMADLTQVRLDEGTMTKHDLPPGVRLYEIAGPLFFGAAQKAMSTLDTVEKGKQQAVILILSQVPTIDATGLVALETMLGRLERQHNKVYLVGLAPQPLDTVKRAGLEKHATVVPTLDDALSLAILYVSSSLKQSAA